MKPSHRRRIRNLGILVAIGAAGVAWGGSVVQFMTAKSLPDATVDVIDPESGTSTGTSGSDVNIAVGDIILFRFAVQSAPASSSGEMRGIQAYITEYVPANTVVVGARMIDSDGNTIEPRPAGPAVDGCRGGGCNDDGSVAQVYADTGIFFSTRSAAGSPAPTAHVPTNSFLTTENGILQNPVAAAIKPQITAPLNINNQTSFFSHNEWDNDQLDALGDSSSGFSSGNTPHGYGSPVAGPDTHYAFEINTNGSRTGAVGPWQRVFYPGSHIGTGSAGAGSNNENIRVGVETATGFDLKPLNATAATAVRYALGEAQIGEPRFVEVALRVTGVPIDPTFGSAGGNVDCSEVFGSDSSGHSNNTGTINPWAFFVPYPQCVFLRLKFDLTADRLVANTGNIAYTIFGKNLAVTTEENARAVVSFVGADQGLASGVPILLNGVPVTPVTTCPVGTVLCEATCTDDSSRTCLTFALGDLAPSDEIDISLSLTAATSGKRTAVVYATYLSDQLSGCPSCVPAVPAIDPKGFRSTAVTVALDSQLPVLALSNNDTVNGPITAAFAAANSTSWAINGSVTNAGSANWTSNSITIVLPASNWQVRSNTGTANRITVGAVGGVGGTESGNCTTPTLAQAGANFASERICSIGQTYTPGEARAINFRVDVPAGESTGLKTIGIKAFGDMFETFVPKAVVVPVGQVRSHKPILDCPITSTQPSVTGSTDATEPTATVKLFFNLITRGSPTAAVATDFAISDYRTLPSANVLSFGELYGGLEIRATAKQGTELESELSDSCNVISTRECSDGFDNDGDGLFDFPADPGCDSPNDNTEANGALPQCSDGIDNPGSVAAIDWPADPSCTDPSDNTENGVAACADGVDNDGDGETDFAGGDTDCTSAADGTEVFYRQCQDGLDNDLPTDGLIDFPADPGCHSLFDDDEFDGGSSTLQTKARLLLAVDSSGSMNWNTCADDFTGGDGSTECPGAAVTCATCGPAGTHPNCPTAAPDDSRLYQVEDGLSNVVAGFGEVEYALMRFHQRSMPFLCPVPAAGRQSGGWQGGGAAPCGGGFAAGDLLVSFAQDNEPTILDWMNHDSDYDGVAPIGTDFEIRGSGTTPLGGILTSAKTYLDGVRTTDLKAACRPYRVILVTDGGETCGGTPTTAATALLTSPPLVGTPPVGMPVTVIGFATPDPVVIDNLDDIAEAGGTCRHTTTGAPCARGTASCQCAIFVSDEAALSAAIAQVIEDSILVETCNGLDDDCDTFADEDFPDLGDDCDNGQVGVCAATGTIDCTGCNAPFVTPGTEACNGLDDDCDTKVDEGVLGCSCVPIGEICNGLDDDCNGVPDDGILPGVGDACGLSIGECTPGTLECVGSGLTCDVGPPFVGPTTETCNTLDDDCDTFVDEVASSCYGPTAFVPPGCTFAAGVWTCEGLCQPGVQTCATAPGACDGDVLPVTDICDGLDNDCDGTTDEGFNLGAACDNGLDGACFATGVIVCNASGGTSCTAPVIPPGIEVCNAVDDDCDALIDEPADLGPPIGDPCGTCGGVFECDPTGPADPTPIECGGSGSCCGTEVCDGADNDCDGTADDEVPGFGGDCVPVGFEAYMTCTDGGGATCTMGTAGCTCVPLGTCMFGHLECTGGTPDCRDYMGPSGEVPCNGIDEDCDGDDDVTCPGAQACTPLGCALPCGPGEFPCQFGFRCEDFPTLGRYCVPDPCADVQCDPGFACDSVTGDCIDLCDGITCPTGATCLNGLCQDCFQLGCPDGELCVLDTTTDLGECVADACAGVVCDDGEFCEDGECVPVLEDLCAEVSCPDGQVCNPEDGLCDTDQCADVRCDDGEACNPHTGDCIPDPCAQIDCPEGLDCEIAPDDTATCRAPVEAPTEVIFGGGGGCCSTGGSSDDHAGTIVLTLLGAIVWRRRRRASQEC